MEPRTIIAFGPTPKSCREPFLTEKLLTEYDLTGLYCNYMINIDYEKVKFSNLIRHFRVKVFSRKHKYIEIGTPMSIEDCKFIQ